MRAGSTWGTQTIGFIVGVAVAWWITARSWDAFDSPLPTLGVATVALTAATFMALRSVASGDAGYGDTRWPRAAGWVIGLAVGAALTSAALIMFTHEHTRGYP